MQYLKIAPIKIGVGRRCIILLEEFDEVKKGVVDVFDIVTPIEGFPEVAVSCFSRLTFERLINQLDAQVIATISMANMETPVYKATYEGVDIALFMAYVGAAGCVGVIEDVFAMGAKKLVLFGTCGVLDANIKDCSIIIPTSALRDEGTSYHYAPASDEILVNPKYKDEFISILKAHGCQYTEGKVWTTDAMYRETRDKVNKRKAAGCICVDMECSAVAALAQFRGKEVFHFFYATDNLDQENWDQRSLANDANIQEKDRIAQLALEFVVKAMA